MTSYVGAWAEAFAVTVVVEVAVAGWLFTRGERTTQERARVLAIVAFAQLASHPAVWFILPELGLGAARVPISEAWAVLIEAAFYAVALRARPTLALGVSLLANGASFGLGLILRRLMLL